jgi:hypothetical protein
MKRLLPLILCASVSHAATLDPIAARDAALQQLRTFHPETLIPGFKSAPSEVSVNPNATGDLTQLNAAASARVARDKTARFVAEEGRRHESEAKPDITFETRKGERLLEAYEGEVVNIPCADGSCDTTVAEESNDVGEGVTELGVVSETAKEASVHQVQEGQFGLFVGNHQKCGVYKIGFNVRNCCKHDDIACPKESAPLRQAIQEKRVFPIGKYKAHGERYYVYCVFTSKLAEIIQVQGRLGQLGINFGEARWPNCRGLTPEEMQRIDFHSLNLSELTSGFTSRTQTPSDAALDAGNASHASKLYDQGAAHD